MLQSDIPIRIQLPLVSMRELLSGGSIVSGALPAAALPLNPLFFRLCRELSPEEPLAAAGALASRVLLVRGSGEAVPPGRWREEPFSGLSVQTPEGDARFLPYDLAPLLAGKQGYFVERGLLLALRRRLARKYRVFTLDASRLADRVGPDGVLLDFRTRPGGIPSAEKRLYVESVGQQDDGALLSQLRLLLPELNASAFCEDDGDLIRYTFFLVDFSKTIRGGSFGAFSPVFRKGISIRIDGEDEPVVFLPFEKSANMARRSAISFVDARLYDVIGERLMNGMTVRRANLSKLYAYRGLSLSAARRVELGFGALSEESVVVIDDDVHAEYVGKKELLTARRVPGGAGEAWELIEPPEEHPDAVKTGKFQGKIKLSGLNEFDGEGLILRNPPEKPGIAEKIRAQLSAEGASSFQIRMPFVKGMLHEVDFLRFLREETGAASLDGLAFTDIYGIRRPAAKVRVLLTKSMFKCAKWLGSFFSSLPAETREVFGGDPMRFYFLHLRKYGWTLCVGGTDRGLASSGRISLNYQFLSTLALRPDELDALLAQTREALDASGAEADGGDEDEPEHILAEPVWRRALRRNSAFLADEKIRSELAQERRAGARGICFGRLTAEGCNRFLSRDLLALLLHAARNVFGGWEHAPQPLLEARALCLGEAECYLPGAVRAAAGEACGFLRNPHLSRCEQVALRRYVPAAEGRRARLYTDYLSHLTGVAMIPYRSLAAMALGGADFDGDLVKVITEESVVRAILRGVYGKEERGGFLKRRLPVVQIPEAGAQEREVPRLVDFGAIRDTFSNAIGLLSYAAVALSGREYGGADPAYANRCELCTILTGLEIDAAKTGRHPELSGLLPAQDGTASAESLSASLAASPYVRCLMALRRLPGGARCFVRKKGSAYALTSPAAGAELSRAVCASESDARLSSVGRLPLAYLKLAYELEQRERSEEAAERKRRSGDEQLPGGIFAGDARLAFAIFGGDDAETPLPERAAACLDEPLRLRLAALMTAYCGVMRLPAYARELSAGGSNALACARTILGLQYDGGDRGVGLPAESGWEGSDLTLLDALAAAQGAILRAAGFSPEKTYGDGEALSVMRRAGAMLEEAVSPEKGLPWLLTARGSRRERLADLLGERPDPAAAALLTRFSCCGYHLLCYLLRDAAVMLRDRFAGALVAERAGGSLRETLRRAGADGGKKRQAAPVFDPAFYEETYRELAAVYRRAVSERESRAVWHAEIAALCRKRLLALLPDPAQAALAVYLLRGADPDRRFFWSGALRGDEILRAVREEEKQDA